MVDPETSARGLHAVLHQSGPIPLAAEILCAPGEVLALVGPSGSGKSTLLRCIAGLYTPREGRVACSGETWLDTGGGIRLSPARRRIGMVFQNYALFPHLSALENVQEAMASPATPQARARALELLDKVHLEGLSARRPRELSGGQQQRVALARALARDPQALLLDEPFSAVDRATRERLYGELAELRRELRMPVVLVTHDLDEAVILADRLTLLSRGRSIQSGAPLEVMQRPATLEAAHLAGIENLFSAQVLAHCLDGGFTLLAWNGDQVRARLQPAFPVGTRVAWAIHTAGVLLMPRNRPPRGRLDHPLEGRVTGMLGLVDRVRVQVLVFGQAEQALTMSIPRHLVDRYAICEGGSIALRLRGEHIQVMPDEVSSASGPIQ
jgi:molybdate transport system ATP-binding protein